MSPTTAAHAHAAGITSADWTAIGTIALAAVTVLVTFWLTWQDRRRVKAQERKEQEAEAYLVEVVQAVIGVEPPSQSGNAQLAVVMVNHGHYTITQIEASYCPGGDDRRVLPFGGTKQVVLEQGIGSLLPSAAWLRGQPWVLDSSRLAPWEAGLRIESDTISAVMARTAYPIVQWTDWRGTRWEHKRGVVRKVKPGEGWAP
jgi:hypothetical protein